MKYLLWIFLIIIFISRFILNQPHFVDGQKLKLSGRLLSEPSTSYGSSNFSLFGVGVSIPQNLDVHYGDKVTIEGEYSQGKLKNPKVDKIIVSSNFFINIRKKLISFYNSTLRQPDASLVSGITIGVKSELSKNFSNKLKTSGTTHIVVASGTNLTILAQFVLTFALSFLTRKKALFLTTISIWSYTFITGFEAPIIRAAVMASIVFTAQIFGRITNTLRITFLTALLMLIVVPSWITDIGFILSFATTISLVLFQSKVNTFIKQTLPVLPEIVRDDLGTSIAAQLASAPIIYYFFGNFNILSPLINVAVLWTVVPIMLIGGVSGILSFIVPDLAKLTLQLVYPLTSWFITIVTL